MDLATLVNRYNTDLAGLLDKHAPLQNKSVLVNNKEPWHTPTVRNALQLCRKYERAFRKSGLRKDEHFLLYE